MLVIPPAMQKVLARQPWPRATPDDVARLRAVPPLPVPDIYFELITRYGCPSFNEPDDACDFRYAYEEPGLSMEFDGAISHFLAPDKVQAYYKGLVVDEAPDLPKFPAFMLPIGMDFDQNTILLECGGESDRIWYWEFQAEPWGDGNNVRLGKVAPTLQAFLDKLYTKPL